ncbi:trypsin-like serine peptidase [Kitasatospora sp. NPDC001540]|uniref:trypsin-like serine peptidase n=1 Tax=Kitasatospora sp. NPDC001540 TaxID=3364014 RepID=UPI0036AFCC84
MAVLTAAGLLAVASAGAARASSAAPDHTGTADGVTFSVISQTDSEIQSFWTPERIREAADHPVPLPHLTGSAAKESNRKAIRRQADAAAKGAAAASADAVAPLALRKQEASNGLVAGATAITSLSRSELAGPALGWQSALTGRLFFNNGGSLSSCSAAVIVSNNKNSIWTAGHCLNRGNGGGFYSGFLFSPGYDSNQRWGYWSLRSVIVSSDWADDGDMNWGDIGGGIVNPLSEYGNLEDFMGGYGYHFSGGTDYSDVTAIGYPADGYNRPDSDFSDGEHAMYCQGATVDAFNWNPLDDRLRMACDMGHGASGGPMIQNFASNPQIVGVNSHRSADSNGNWVDNYLYSSNHGGDAVGVINWLNAH